MTISADDLLDAGYKQHSHYEEFCDNKLYQKCFKDVKGNKLYYVECYLWRFPQMPSGTVNKVEFKSRLYLPEHNTLVGTTGFTLQVHAEDKCTVEQAEAFYAQAYKVLGCVPDLHNR
jgi:hypothetical protein